MLPGILRFLSTPSARRATRRKRPQGPEIRHFYPRPPRGGRRLHVLAANRAARHFYPRPPRGGRPEVQCCCTNRRIFLSTPSARRATLGIIAAAHAQAISIHALREEGDLRRAARPEPGNLFLSTPSARRATVDAYGDYHTNTISIHALREEGDGGLGKAGVPARVDFYPRPPRGGRHVLAQLFGVEQVFLSTPSARRATKAHCTRPRKAGHFYPRPPRGGRPPARPLQPRLPDFYPRPPRGGRQQKQRENTLLLSHYTPLCTNCKEMSAKQTAKSHRYLRKRLVFRCEASRKTMCAADSHWPDIKRSARCLGQILGAVQRARPSSGSCCPAGRTADCPRRGRSGRSALL